MTDWKTLIACLPPGLSFRQGARRLGRDYWKTRAAMRKHGYKWVDGRPTARRVESEVDWAAVDWRKSNVAIGLEVKRSRELVRRWRERVGAPKIGNRGRPRKIK